MRADTDETVTDKEAASSLRERTIARISAHDGPIITVLVAPDLTKAEVVQAVAVPISDREEHNQSKRAFSFLIYVLYLASNAIERATQELFTANPDLVKGITGDALGRVAERLFEKIDRMTEEE